MPHLDSVFQYERRIILAHQTHVLAPTANEGQSVPLPLPHPLLLLCLLLHPLPLIPLLLLLHCLPLPAMETLPPPCKLLRRF